LNSDLLERLRRTPIASHYPTSASSAFLCFFSFWGGDEDAVAQLTSPKMNQTTPDNLFYSNKEWWGTNQVQPSHMLNTPTIPPQQKENQRVLYLWIMCLPIFMVKKSSPPD
jgi:hypothetical protein